MSQILFQIIHFKFQACCKNDRTRVSTNKDCCCCYKLCNQLFLEVDKKNFRFATLALLHQVKLNIARQNDYTKQNINVLHFLANKPSHELSGVRKKRKKPFALRVLSVRIQHHGLSCEQHCRTKPKMTKHSRKSSHSFKVHPLIGKIQSKLFPLATLIQLSGVRMNYFEV